MKRLVRLIATVGFAIILQSCAIYPYGHPLAYGGYAPYNNYNYGYQPYRNFGWGGGYGGHYGWGGGHHWNGGGWGGYHGWGGGHGHH